MTFNKFAFILGTMIGADWITENEVNGVEKIARTKRLIAAAPDIWDTNQWLLEHT